MRVSPGTVMKVAVLSALLCLASVLAAHNTMSRYRTFLRLNDNDYRNHSYVDFNLVGGRNTEALSCRSDLGTCCQDNHTGDWYFPDGEKLSNNRSSSDIYITRAFKSVQIRRQNNAPTAGIYRCEIETSVESGDSREILYAGLYSSGGNITIPGTMQFIVDSDLSGESPQFTLTFNSTGGPATTVTWTRDSVIYVGRESVLDDTVTARYIHTLTVTGTLPGYYECSVSNNKPSTATVNFTVQVATAPTNLMAVQEGPTSIRVSWSPPSPQGDTSGYRITYSDYSAGSSGSVNVSGWYTNNSPLTGLLNGAMYTVSIVGTSDHFPSDQEEYSHSVHLMPVPGKPSIIVSSTTAFSIHLTWSVPSGSVVESYEVVWERDTSGECPDEDVGHTTIIPGPTGTHGPTSFNIVRLEESSIYTITVTATNKAGSVVSDPVTPMTGETAPLAPPTSVSVSTVTFSSVTVQWGAVDCIHRNGDITGYIVQYRAQEGGNARRRQVPGGASTETTLIQLNDATAYLIEVAAVNSAGIGVYSEAITAITESIGHGVNGGECAVGGAVGGVIATYLVVTLVAVLFWWRWRRQHSKGECFPTTCPNLGYKKRNIQHQQRTMVNGNAFAPIIEQLPTGRQEDEFVETKYTQQEPAITESTSTIAFTHFGNHEERNHWENNEAVYDVLEQPAVIYENTCAHNIEQFPAERTEGEMRLLVEAEKEQPSTQSPSVVAKAYFSNHEDRHHLENNQAFINECEHSTAVYENTFAHNVEQFPAERRESEVRWHMEAEQTQQEQTRAISASPVAVVDFHEERSNRENNQAWIEQTGVTNDRLGARNIEHFPAERREMDVRLHVKTKQTEEDQTSTRSAGAVAVAYFGDHVEKNHSENNQDFIDEYESLCSSSREPLTAETTDDGNQVVLKQLEGYECTYMNASYVDGYSVSRLYIATEDPQPETVVNFWRMVWQERAPSVVMITSLEEQDRPTCQQYWPDSGTERIGPFQVSITEQVTLAYYTIRKLTVQLSSSAECTLDVTQFHFMAWPDDGVPDYATPFLAFHRRVKKEHKVLEGSMVVHCSDGVGPTGTFIAIDHVLEQIEREDVVDIPGVIQSIRQQRMNMVDTVDQYIFIHDAILESVTCGNTQIDAGNLKVTLDKLLRMDQSGRTEIDNQFAILNKVSPNPSMVQCVAAKRNTENYLSAESLPGNRWRMVLREQPPGLFNTIDVHGYRRQRAFIITHDPTLSTASDFWEMVIDRKSRVIVMLSDLVEGGEDVCYKYWPTNGFEEFEELTVELVREEMLQGFVLRTLNVQQSSSGNSHEVSQFHITNWAPDGSCSNLKTVTDVIEEMFKIQRRTGGQPIFVHCSDTVTRSGIFCAIATIIEQCKIEGVVNVFQVVKALRVQRPGAVHTVVQYQLIFDALLAYLDSFSEYADI